MKKLTVIKIGGKVIDDQAALDSFLKAFSEVEGPKILVHGGGKVASEFGERLGLAPNLVEGRRITDEATLELVTMVYGGLVNKNIVAKLQALDIDTIGLTGADGNVLSAVKRPVKTIDYGFVGDITKANVNVKRLSNMVEEELVPVICPLTHDGEGSLLNTNADTMASVIASAMAEVYEVQLIYCFEQKGVLRDLDKNEVIPQINQDSYASFKEEGIISDGMIPKLDNAFDAAKKGVKEVLIGHFSDLVALIKGEETGTKIGN